MRNIIRLLPIVIGLFWILTAFLTGPNAPATEQQSLLWKIEGKGQKQASYLFGTMHLIQKDYYYFPESLEKLVKKSDALVMEIGDLGNQAEMMKYILLPEGKTFFDYFNKQQTDTILAWAKEKMNMGEDAFRANFARMKPFVVVQTATQLSFMGKTESYERTLDRIAKDHKINIIGLETVAEQMSMFDKLSDEQQAEMVLSGIRDEAKNLQITTEMQAMYRRQRIDSLYLYIQQEGGVIASNNADFLDNRNKNWIPKIVELMATQRLFIAVGAGHLSGPNGVIQLLRNEGYTVTPVKL